MSRKSKINISDIRTLFENGNSTYQIAEELKCNQSHVYRTIQKWNKAHPNDLIQIRSKSDAQKLFMDKHGHQRVGTSHSEDSKEAISGKMKDYYDSPEGKETKERIAEIRKAEWDSKSDVEKNEAIADLHAANREQLKKGIGSKFENYVAQELTLSNFSVEQRSRRFAGGSMEVDIALLNDALAIEIDGPTHWMNVYNQPGKLEEVQAKDKIKNNALTSVGWDVLRVQDKSGSCTRARVSRIVEKISEIRKERTRTGKPSVYIMRL